MRFALGRPGSLSRWLVGSAAALIAVGVIAVVTGWLPVLLFPLPVIYGWFWYRGSLIGDEDELKAEFPSRVADAIRNPKAAEDDELRAGPPSWRDTQLEHFQGVPLPPVAQDPEDGVE